MTIYNLLIAVGFVIGFAPFLLWVILAAAVPMVILTWFFTPRLRQRSIANRVANSDLTSRLQETFAANKIVKANRAEQIVLDRFRRDSSRALNAALYYRFEMIVLSMLVALIGGFAIIGLEYVMVGWVVTNEQTYLGAAFAWLIGFTLWNLGAFEAARGRVEQVINTNRGIVRWWSMLQDLFIGLERAFYFIDLAPDVTDVDEPRTYPEPIRTVRWSDVSFAYQPNAPVLREVNLNANVGTMTAIVGQTGSGKSTLMSMLLRLYDPSKGRIEINGVDLRQLKIEDVRSNCAIALQKNVLFTGKVADNISYATLNKTREDIEAAARVACAHEFIMSMADGYDTELGERGSKLSSGQRQRLSIARAVIRDTPILILDEPTASLDASTEQDVLNNLAGWGRDKMVFIITHRLSTIRNADQIAVLKDGAISEVGSHEQLLSNSDGDYSRFIRAATMGRPMSDERGKADVTIVTTRKGADIRAGLLGGARFDDRIDTNTDISGRETLTLVIRSLMLLKEVWRLFLFKFLMAFAMVFPGLFLGWLFKIITDHVILNRPLVVDQVNFPPHMYPLLRYLEGMERMDIMFTISCIFVAGLLLIGFRVGGTGAGTYGGRDAAGEAENQISSSGSEAGAIWGILEWWVDVRLTQYIINNLRTRLFDRLTRASITTLDDQRVGDQVYRVMYDAACGTDAIWWYRCHRGNAGWCVGAIPATCCGGTPGIFLYRLSHGGGSGWHRNTD